MKGEKMSKFEEIDRALIAILDIVRFSKQRLKVQADLVSMFVTNLNDRLIKLKELKPDALSTGDGAIVAIGRDCNIDEEETRMFMDFVIDFVAEMAKAGLLLRAVVNYSVKDRVLIIEGLETFQGRYIQVGDTINVAARIITFCEPCEIMINNSVYEWLRKVDLDELYSFRKNDPFTTKHGDTLATYSYDPKEEERGILYDPNSASHAYKKYNYFPPITGKVVQYFMKHGLDFELKKVISYAFDSIKDINYTKRMISWNNVIRVLIQLRYDPDDSVYVLSRDERKSCFWTQPRRETYTKYLENNAKLHGGYINQTRVRVYHYSHDTQLMPADDIHDALVRLHKPKSYFRFPSAYLFKYERLMET